MPCAACLPRTRPRRVPRGPAVLSFPDSPPRQVVLMYKSGDAANEQALEALLAAERAVQEAIEFGDMEGAEKIAFKKCDRWDFQLWASAPVLANGWTLLGEPSKWVPVSSSRFEDLQVSSDGDTTSVSVTANGPPGETITVAWLKPGASSTRNPSPMLVNCTIPAGGAVSVRVHSGTGTRMCVTPS